MFKNFVKNYEKNPTQQILNFFIKNWLPKVVRMTKKSVFGAKQYHQRLGSCKN
jgi:hypothetical protein